MSTSLPTAGCSLSSFGGVQDPSRQVDNVAVDFEVGAEVSEALLAMEADEHYDWDPSGVA